MATPKPTGQPTIGTQFSPNPPEVDWKKLEKDFESELQKGLQELRDELELVWHEKAAAELRTSSIEYMNGVNLHVTSDGVEATISGWLPVSLESGHPRFDMKKGLLAGRSSRVIPMHDGGFRTVSTKSPQSSWWHPGLEAKKIGEQVKKETPAIAKKIFTPILARIKI